MQAERQKNVFAFVGAPVTSFVVKTLYQILEPLCELAGHKVQVVKELEKEGLAFQIWDSVLEPHQIEVLYTDDNFNVILIGLADHQAVPSKSFSFLNTDLTIVLKNESSCERHLRRFVELLFGNPFHPPDPDEQAMMHAYVARLASSDLSRQVGAALYNKEGCLISTGYNDVPKAGGGFYTNEIPKDRDARDFRLRRNSSHDAKQEIYEQILMYLRDQKNISIPDTFLEEMTLKKMLIELKEHTSFMDILEYSRNVHAEMSCLMNALRMGQSVVGGTLYTTTFPCHKCAKHLVAAGIKKVVYLDRFEKSRAFDLFDDSLMTDGDGVHQNRDKVLFTPFMGITPRRYVLFEANQRERETGEMVAWVPHWRDKQKTKIYF